MKIRVPVVRIIRLLGKLLQAAPGGISPAERYALVVELVELLAELAPDHVEVPIRG